MMDKKWVEIDYCPECRWIWLDKWELEKLSQAEKIYNQNNFEEEYNDRKKYDEHWYQSNQNYWNNPNKKKKSFLDSFDIFD